MFHLFLPNFPMQTPLHKLFMDESFYLFNRIAEQINDISFNQFFDYKQHFYLEKIRKMFVFILENVSSYDKNAIERCYCKLQLASDAKQEISNEAKMNMNKIEAFLWRIKGYISKGFYHSELLIDVTKHF